MSNIFIILLFFLSFFQKLKKKWVNKVNSKFPGFSFLFRYVIIRSAINLRTTAKDQFPLEIFVFGESIPVLFG